VGDSSGKGDIIVEETAKFFGKGGGELGTSVRDDLIIKSKASVDSFQK
jgi:hypothetical protein